MLFNYIAVSAVRNRCKYNAESFQENLSLLADPLVEDSLELKNSNGKDIKVTDNIRR